jgi:hypothetical protein
MVEFFCMQNNFLIWPGVLYSPPIGRAWRWNIVRETSRKRERKKSLFWFEIWLPFKMLPGDVALSCNPSYWEARTVGWLEVENLHICSRWYLVAALWSSTWWYGLRQSCCTTWGNKPGRSLMRLLHQKDDGSKPRRTTPTQSPDPVLNIVL